MTPRILHTIHFQWDENQRVDPRGAEFDRAPLAALGEYAPDFEVRLWTYPRCRDFCLRQDPDLWTQLQACARPVMLIDVLRWLIVYRFGGIYWQMRTVPLVEMSAFLPAEGKSVRLFTEGEQTPEQCRLAAAEPIRCGQPEEPIRVSNQVFAAPPGSPYVKKTIDFLLERIRTLVPRKDYDVLYISANGAVSSAYDRFGQGDPSVERTDLANSRRMMKWRYGGSWRTDKRTPEPPPPPPPPAPRMDRVPWLASLCYARFKRHPHETLVERMDAVQPRTSCLPQLMPWIEKRGLRTLFEAPSGAFVPAGGTIRYTGGDPSRAVVAANRRRIQAEGIRFRHVNLLYSRFPSVDLFICPGFLEWLSFGEARRVLRRIAAAKPRYLALSGCRLLLENWETALGDFRPINPRREPFLLPEPEETIAWKPAAGGRPDRCLQVWKMP